MNFREIYSILNEARIGNKVAWTQAQVELLLHGVILFENPNHLNSLCFIILNDKFDILNGNTYIPRKLQATELLHIADQVLIKKTNDESEYVYVWKDRFDFNNIHQGKLISLTTFITKNDIL